jgi:hypothetical protein
MGVYNMGMQTDGSCPQRTLTKADKVVLRQEPKDMSLTPP